MQHWYQKTCPLPCEESALKAKQRQNNLTKPVGSLGRLEDIAIAFAGWQRTTTPTLDKIMVRVFAADHGICAQNISAFPQEVTMQMVMNFIQGGAAINVLSEKQDADFAVVNMGLSTPLPPEYTKSPHPLLINTPILDDQGNSTGTKDFSQFDAMSQTQALQALTTGKNIVLSEKDQRPQLFIGGEMGIGNTSSASAIYCALLDLPAQEVCGPGTGVDAKGIRHKSAIIHNALLKHQLIASSFSENTSKNAQLNRNDPSSTFEVLCKVGGFEIAALAGAYIAAAQQQTPSLIDGFISTAAALIAINLNPSCRPWLLFSHQSAEPAHHLALKHVNAEPLLNIGMRLGEGSGAAMCISILKSALELHNNMATFAEAMVSEKN